MKKIQLICVGKLKEPFYSAAIAEYAKRLGKFCEFSVKELPDYADSGDSVSRESASILGEIDGYSILTDIGGALCSSEDFATMIEKAFITSPKVQIIIGGSRGVSDEVKDRVSKRISFGRMTYPHQLMRVIAAEQIYRAMTISSGTPYHK